jgi:phosphoribosylamine---glycine ligase
MMVLRQASSNLGSPQHRTGLRRAGAACRRVPLHIAAALDGPTNVLLVGSGGREHALAWKLAQSTQCQTLFAAPGNPGIGAEPKTTLLPDLDVTDHAAVVAFCRANGIGLVMIGPEAPLVAGLADDLAAAGVRAFGPTAAAARLEGSKSFMKDLCKRAGIPTAGYEAFTDAEAAKAYIRATGAPIVVKASGLAAGKGVVVAATVEEACAAADDMLLGGMFGDAGVCRCGGRINHRDICGKVPYPTSCLAHLVGWGSSSSGCNHSPATAPDQS